MSTNTNIPKDPMMLLSYTNTQLRDHFKTLDDMCVTLNINKDNLLSTLALIDYEYDAVLNKFI